MDRPSLIAFDLDATLVDQERAATSGLHRWVESLQVRPTTELNAAWFRIEETHVRQWRDGVVTWDDERTGDGGVKVPVVLNTCPRIRSARFPLTN